METIKGNNRSLALKWWGDIDINTRREYVTRWKKSLPDTYSSGKLWTFEMINSSSRKIQEIFEWYNA